MKGRRKADIPCIGIINSHDDDVTEEKSDPRVRLFDQGQAHISREVNGFSVSSKNCTMNCLYVELMYCQSKEMLRSPKPSLPSAPPKRLVMISLVFDDAF